MLGLAIAGARRGGAIGRVIAARDDCRVAAVCDRALDRAAALAHHLDCPVATDDYSSLLERSDVDAIVIATPPPYHVPLAVQALRAGKHVLSEVPALWRPEEGPELVAAARASDAVYMLAENMAYFAWVVAFAEMVRAGFIGEPVYAECEYIHDLRGRMIATASHDAFDSTGRTWRAAIGPAQYCTHDLGPVLRMFNDRVETVVGMHTGAHIMPEADVIDAEVILCHTAGGRVIKFLASFANARGSSMHFFSIYGTEGVLESPRAGGEPFKLRSSRLPHTSDWIKLPLGVDFPTLAGRVPTGGHGTSEWLMFEDFVRAIRGDQPPAIDVYTALDWSLPGLLGHISARRGSVPIAVPDPRQW